MSNTEGAAPAVDPSLADVAEIELPPEAIMDEILATEEKDAASKPADASKPPRPAGEVAELAFERERSTSIDLDFPFSFKGERFTTITVRRLTGNEIADFVRAHLDDEGNYDRPELNALMAGLPASVLRALDADDHFKITQACAAFLPRALGGGG